MNKDKIMKMIVILASIVVIAGSLSRLIQRDSLTLTEYESLNSGSLSRQEDGGSPDDAEDALPPSSENSGSEESRGMPSGETGSGTEPSSEDTSLAESGSNASPAPENQDSPLLTGAALNGNSQLEERVCVTDDFYYEPVSDRLKRYMTGISYPETGSASDTLPEDDSGAAPDRKPDAEKETEPEIGFEELRYVHILHYDFEGNSVPGELICNEYIAQDLTEIFYELYRNEYRLEKVLLIDEYDGDDELSMEDNNTSCFNYRPVTNNTGLSMHALGLAVDINPLYNPYIAYSKDGSREVLPASAQAYADRELSFPYKIDEDDLCYKLFTQHGFIWGGNWNNVKDYQHFQKSRPQ